MAEIDLLGEWCHLLSVFEIRSRDADWRNSVVSRDAAIACLPDVRSWCVLNQHVTAARQAEWLIKNFTKDTAMPNQTVSDALRTVIGPLVGELQQHRKVAEAERLMVKRAAAAARKAQNARKQA